MPTLTDPNIARKQNSVTHHARLILLLYAAVYYLLPAFLTVLFGAPLDQVLISSPSYTLGGVFCIFVVAAVYFAIGWVRTPPLRFLRNFAAVILNSYSALIASLVYFLLSVYFWQKFGLSYRQTGARIENSGSSVILLYIFQNYVLALLVYLVGVNGSDLRSNFVKNSATIMFIMVGTLLSVQASSNVITLIASFVVAGRLWINKDFLRPESLSVSRRIFIGIIFGMSVLGALFVGIANKRGVDQTIFLFSHNIDEIIRIFQSRLSYNFYCASFHVTYNFTNLDLGWKAVSEVYYNIHHRVDVLLGKPTIFNDITSVKRLNYEMIAFYFRDRTGTAPGMVGSIFFYPLGVFALPLIIYFYAVVFKVVSTVAGVRRPSALELVYLMLFTGGIIDSSIDLFNPFDTPFTKFFFLLCAYAYVTGKKAETVVIAVEDFRASDGKLPRLNTRGL